MNLSIVEGQSPGCDLTVTYASRVTRVRVGEQTIRKTPTMAQNDFTLLFLKTVEAILENLALAYELPAISRPQRHANCRYGALTSPSGLARGCRPFMSTLRAGQASKMQGAPPALTTQEGTCIGSVDQVIVHTRG